ncbi:MAG: ATP-dependent protease, partial [Phycisphaerae bacterium]|nr:ATP-dependent protease [Phycisphaerae bacterium]
MSDGDKEPITPKTLDEQLREIFRRANVSFMGEPAPEDGAAEETKDTPGSEAPSRLEARIRAVREFSLKPRDIREYLDRFVIRQDEAKQVLSVAICDHY